MCVYCKGAPACDHERDACAASHVRSFITFGADAPYHLSPRIHTGVRTDSGEDRFFLWLADQEELLRRDFEYAWPRPGPLAEGATDGEQGA